MVSWLKKYTIVGGFFSNDKKYLLKEFFFISVYAVTCLSINRITLWPVGLSVIVLLGCFLLFDVFIRKMEASYGK